MNVYVASAQQDYERARYAMQLLQAGGCQIAHDWTHEVERHRQTQATPEELDDYAVDDFNGVRKADVLLVLTPAWQSWGKAMWTELGIALAMGKRIIVTGAMRDSNIFCRLCECYRYDEEGIQAVLGCAT